MGIAVDFPVSLWGGRAQTCCRSVAVGLSRLDLQPRFTILRSQRDSKFENMGREMVRASVLAAGGIVLRRERTPLIAVVRLRKRNEWVLPKGKLDAGETPRAAAEREVMEETGHDVSVHEFLGTLVYESGGRSKVVHYWRMETGSKPAHDLMNDVTAVDWLPLDAAVERLSRGHERAFLANVGPLALAAAMPAKLARRPKAKQPVRRRPQDRQVAAVPPLLPMQASIPPQPESIFQETAPDAQPLVAAAPIEVEPTICPPEFENATPFAESDFEVLSVEPEAGNDEPAWPIRDRCRSMVLKVRDWLQRSA
jgi:8-oxo-dGTP diphosphatase